MNISTSSPSQLSTIVKELNDLTTTPILRAILITPPILSFSMFAIIVIYSRKLPPQVPLYYSLPWGEEQLTHPVMLLLLPVGTLLWYVISCLLIHFQMKEYRVFSQLILIVQLIVTVMALLTELNIVQLII